MCCRGSVARFSAARFSAARPAAADARPAQPPTQRQTAALCLPSLSFGNINLAEIFVYLMICLTALGATMAYVVFISTTMPDVIKGAKPVRRAAPLLLRARHGWRVALEFRRVTNGSWFCSAPSSLPPPPTPPLLYPRVPPQWEILLGLIPICIPLLLLRTFKFLAFTSILGDFAVLAGTSDPRPALRAATPRTPATPLIPDHPAFTPRRLGHCGLRRQQLPAEL